MKKKLIVKQEESSDCGVCCLLSIIRYFGGNASLEELRISSITNKEGVNVFNLIRCSIDYGFDSIGIRSDKIPEQLPCIAHIKINNALSHFIVIYGVKGNRVCIMDPSYGYREILISDYYKISTNKYILLTQKSDIKYSYNPNSFILKIKNFIKNNTKSFISILTINICILILSLIYSLYVIVLKHSMNYLTLTLFISLIIVIHYLQYLIKDKTNRFNNKMSLSLIYSFIIHVFSLPLNYIHIKDPNEIIKRIQDLDSIKEITVSFLITLVSNLLIILSVSIFW